MPHPLLEACQPKWLGWPLLQGALPSLLSSGMGCCWAYRFRCACGAVRDALPCCYCERRCPPRSWLRPRCALAGAVACSLLAERSPRCARRARRSGCAAGRCGSSGEHAVRVGAGPASHQSVPRVGTAAKGAPGFGHPTRHIAGTPAEVWRMSRLPRARARGALRGSRLARRRNRCSTLHRACGAPLRCARKSNRLCTTKCPGRAPIGGAVRAA